MSGECSLFGRQANFLVEEGRQTVYCVWSCQTEDLLLEMNVLTVSLLPISVTEKTSEDIFYLEDQLLRSAAIRQKSFKVSYLKIQSMDTGHKLLSFTDCKFLCRRPQVALLYIIKIYLILCGLFYFS